MVIELRSAGSPASSSKKLARSSFVMATPTYQCINTMIHRNSRRASIHGSDRRRRRQQSPARGGRSERSYQRRMRPAPGIGRLAEALSGLAAIPRPATPNGLPSAASWGFALGPRRWPISASPPDHARRRSIRWLQELQRGSRRRQRAGPAGRAGPRSRCPQPSGRMRARQHPSDDARSGPAASFHAGTGAVDYRYILNGGDLRPQHRS